MEQCKSYNQPIIIPDSIEDINPKGFLCKLYNFNSYIKLPHHFPELLDSCMKKYYVPESSIMVMENISNEIKIKGLIEEEFERLHILLPDKFGTYNRKLIYDGID